MLKALWFMIKLSLLTALVVWLAEQPGDVVIHWLGFEVRTSVAFLLVVFIVFILVWTQAHRLWMAVVSMPTALRRYRVAARREKGYRAITAGLVAVAAGDGYAADKSARHAAKLVPDAPLGRLLTAQTALMNGNAPKARREFTALLDNKDTEFFGLRGLLNEHLKDGNRAEALQLIRRAHARQPKRLWVLRTLFDLETRARNWGEAVDVLKQAEKAGLFDRIIARQHRQALFVAQATDAAQAGRAKDAWRLAAKAASPDHGFTPASALLAELCIAAGKKRAAIKTLEKAWAAQPHPVLVSLWQALAPESRAKPSLYDSGRDRYVWTLRLTEQNPAHRESHRAAGAAALDAKMWKEARQRLLQAGDYRALARLEREETGNEQKAREWLEYAADTLPDSKWVCHDCGHALEAWQPLCPDCGVFNSAVWAVPGHDSHAPQKRLAGFDGGLIAPPA